MALQVSTPKREFVIKGSGKGKNKKDDIILSDPHPDMSPQEVINHYKSKYPEIAAATVQGPKMQADKAVYQLNKVIGEHG